jgi:hypothetical protein
MPLSREDSTVYLIDFPPPHPLLGWLGRNLAWLGLRLLYPQGSAGDGPPQRFWVEPVASPRPPGAEGRPRRVLVRRCVEEIYKGATRRNAS